MVSAMPTACARNGSPVRSVLFSYSGAISARVCSRSNEAGPLLSADADVPAVRSGRTILTELIIGSACCRPAAQSRDAQDVARTTDTFADGRHSGRTVGIHAVRAAIRGTPDRR